MLTQCKLWISPSPLLASFHVPNINLSSPEFPIHVTSSSAFRTLVNNHHLGVRSFPRRDSLSTMAKKPNHRSFQTAKDTEGGSRATSEPKVSRLRSDPSLSVDVLEGVKNNSTDSGSPLSHDEQVCPINTPMIANTTFLLNLSWSRPALTRLLRKTMPHHPGLNRQAQFAGSSAG